MEQIDLFSAPSKHLLERDDVLNRSETIERDISGSIDEQEICQNCYVKFLPFSDYVTLCENCRNALLGI
jgi:hypothetical protein